MRQDYKTTPRIISEVYPSTLGETSIECPHCHRVLPNVKYMLLAEPTDDANGIFVKCYEFDEGITQ